MKKFLRIFFIMGLFVLLMPSVFAETNAYSVENLYFTNLSGTVLENPTHSCVVNVEVKKQQLRFGNDEVVIASYATDGSLLGFTMVSGTIGTGETSVFKTLVTFPSDKTLGVIKAYVWNNVFGMQPLSNEFTKSVNEMDEGAEITTPVQEKYIPDTVTVRGTITDSPRSNCSLYNGDYMLDEVYIPTDYSNIYTEQDYNAYNNRITAISRFYGVGTNTYSSYNNRFIVKSEIDLNDYLYCSGYFTLTKDEDDYFVVLNFEPEKSSNVVFANAKDYVSVADGGKSVLSNNKVTFGTKNYAVNPAGVIVVNGLMYGNITDAILANVLELAQGEVKLIDDNTAVDGYDKIMVTSYNIGKVAAVTYANEVTTIQVAYKAGLNPAVSTIKLSDECIADGDVALTVKNADGENIALSSIKKDDIIAYAIDSYISTNTIIDPCFIDIIATDKTVTGMATIEDATDCVYTIGDTEYEEIVWGIPYLSVGTEYEISLDPFGRIFDAEVISTPVKYAIAEKYDSDYGVQLILPDGTAKWFVPDAYAVEDYANISGNASMGRLTFVQFENYIETSKAYSPAERVVKYTIKNSTGRIQSIELVGVSDSYFVYNANTSKLGTKTITDRTSVIDASNYAGNISDYTVFATSSFVNKAEYRASICTADGNSGKAAFVVLTAFIEPVDEPYALISEPDDSYDINQNSRFAVVRKTAVQTLTEDGDICYKVNVLYDGKVQDFLFTTTSGAAALNSGDAFFFKKDSEGLVKSYIKVFDKAYYANNNTSAFRNLGTTSWVTGTNAFSFTFSPVDWDCTIKNAAKKYYQLVYGIVTDVTSNSIEFALESPDYTINLTDDANYEVYGIDADCQTYRYGINEQASLSNQYKAISVAAATASTLGAYETAFRSGIFNLASVDGLGHDHLTYALALIIDGEVVEIYTIVQ